MTGQGVHKTAFAEEQRQAAWAQMCGRETFTAWDMANATGMSPEWGRKVIREWQAEGRIAPAGQDGQTTLWKVVPHTAPSESIFARESRRPEFAMWRTMRDLRRFSAADVHLTANTETTPMTVADVQKYCSMLVETGYLKVAAKVQAGKRLPVYTMQGRPGPFPPRVVRVPTVYDPNLGEFRVLEKRIRP